MYAQSDTLLPADTFNSFQNMCIAIYGLDTAHFLSAPALSWQVVLKKTKVKLDLLTDINMFLMVETGIRCEICHAILEYVKINNKYMKDYDKINNLAMSTIRM